MLPRPETIEISSEEGDPGEALAIQLITYRRFKEIAKWMNNRHEAGLRSYLRVAPLPIKIEPKIDLTGLTLEDLKLAARNVFLFENHRANIDTVVTLPKISIRDRIKTILETLEKNQHVIFQNIPKSKSRTEIVVTFLALLELIKRHIILAQQESMFGEIELNSVGEWDEQQEIDLEFDE